MEIHRLGVCFHTAARVVGELMSSSYQTVGGVGGVIKGKIKLAYRDADDHKRWVKNSNQKAINP